MDLFRELQDLVAALDRERADYALCGAVALAIHGVPRATKDIDLLVLEEQLPRVREVARSCGFTLHSSPMTFSSSGITLHRFTKILDGQPLMLDALIAGPSLKTVWETRERLAWAEGEVSVVSRQGLITLKLAAGRPQDLVDVQRLEELRRG